MGSQNQTTMNCPEDKQTLMEPPSYEIATLSTKALLHDNQSNIYNNPTNNLPQHHVTPPPPYHVTCMPCQRRSTTTILEQLSCRIRAYGIILLFLALFETVGLSMILCCNAYFSKFVTFAGYAEVVVTIAAAAQSVWQLGFIESRGTSLEKVFTSKVLLSICMGVNFLLAVLAIFFTASEPECRHVNKDGGIISTTPTAPPSGKMCYADFHSICFYLLAAIVVLTTLKFGVALATFNKVLGVSDRMREEK